jgi:hypothetical protein
VVRPGESCRSDARHLRLSLCVFRRRNTGMESQNIKESFAAHIAQHYTKRKGGNDRTEHHQHIHLIFHNGPLTTKLARPCASVAHLLIVSVSVTLLQTAALR